MTTWAETDIDTDLLADVGYYEPITVDGTTYPRMVGYMAAAVVECGSIVSGGLTGSIQNSITASVGSPPVLTGTLCIVTSCPASGAVQLAMSAGASTEVLNRCGTGQPLLVKPIASMAIENAATNVAVSLNDGSSARFTFVNGGTIIRERSP